ncbi:MAG: MBL fold metallo-hydrolase [Parvularculaceae bacterium]|nr:MBL fold metallo-hydrolase [Parvularculaceae bacterium]
MAAFVIRAIGGLILLATIAFVAVGFPSVQDRLFQRAVDRAMAPKHADLFDGDGLKVFFCGTGSPLPSKKRAQTCTAVFAGNTFFLVDAGTGSWETIQGAGLPGGKLGGIFLTHFHSDHIGDLSEANLNSWVMGRPAPLAVYGPTGVERVVAGENEALASDALYRTAHHGAAIAPPQAAGLAARPFEPGDSVVVYERDGLKVTAFNVRHDPVIPAVGYRFDYQGRSVVVSGDTAYSDNLIRSAKGADLLIHEAQANHMVKALQTAAARAGNQRLAKILGDIPSYHTTPVEAARAANAAEVKALVLTHLTPAPDNRIARDIFMRHVSSVREGVRLAADGAIVRLPKAGGVRYDGF